MKEETDIRNETKVVEEKLTYMRELNNQLKPLFGTDLVSRFKKINKECKSTASDISVEYINQQMDTVNRKYSFYDKIDPLYTSDYLREATQNSNYADLAIKYAVGTNYEVISKYKTPLNEVASSLSIQYRDKLSLEEQSVLILYNNPKYRLFCDAILNIENFESVPIKTILHELNKVKGFSKLKSECFDSVKRRIDDPSNAKIKGSLFVNYDFTSFETFISSFTVFSVSSVFTVVSKSLFSSSYLATTSSFNESIALYLVNLSLILKASSNLLPQYSLISRLSSSDISKTSYSILVSPTSAIISFWNLHNSLIAS